MASYCTICGREGITDGQKVCVACLSKLSTPEAAAESPPHKKSRFLRRTLLAIFCLVVGIFILLSLVETSLKLKNTAAGLGDSTAAPIGSTAPVASAASAASWRKVTEWSGEGIKETEGFETASREWRITWAASKAGEYGGVFQIYVHRSADDSLVSLAANSTTGGGDTSYVRGRGKHYLKINSGNLRWKVVVEDQH